MFLVSQGTIPRGPGAIERAHIKAVSATLSIAQHGAAVKIMAFHVTPHTILHIAGPAHGRRTVTPRPGLFRLQSVLARRRRSGIVQAGSPASAIGSSRIHYSAERGVQEFRCSGRTAPLEGKRGEQFDSNPHSVARRKEGPPWRSATNETTEAMGYSSNCSRCDAMRCHRPSPPCRRCSPA